MGRRLCVFCGKPIPGYPHVTLWDEQQKDSHGVRFHTIEEAALYLVEKLGWKVTKEAERG